jgi:hypothetical protein
MDINFTELETERHHFLTPAAGANFGHAASVCLESQGHILKVDLEGQGHFHKTYKTIRYDVNDQMKRTWDDEEFATEQGAYGVAFLVASKEMNIKAIKKSRKKTGIDYWLGIEDGFMFQDKVRLEVSGIRKGTSQQLNSRFDTKMKQSTKSDGTGLPALIVIVEFSTPKIKTGLRNMS